MFKKIGSVISGEGKPFLFKSPSGEEYVFLRASEYKRVSGNDLSSLQEIDSFDTLITTIVGAEIFFKKSSEEENIINPEKTNSISSKKSAHEGFASKLTDLKLEEDVRIDDIPL